MCFYSEGFYSARMCFCFLKDVVLFWKDALLLWMSFYSERMCFYFVRICFYFENFGSERMCFSSERICLYFQRIFSEKTCPHSGWMWFYSEKIYFYSERMTLQFDVGICCSISGWIVKLDGGSRRWLLTSRSSWRWWNSRTDVWVLSIHRLSRLRDSLIRLRLI